MLNAKQTVFTVTYRKKVKPEDIESALTLQKKNVNIPNSKLIEGKLNTITCFLLKCEENLGRTIVINLSEDYGKGYR